MEVGWPEKAEGRRAGMLPCPFPLARPAPCRADKLAARRCDHIPDWDCLAAAIALANAALSIAV